MIEVLPELVRKAFDFIGQHQLTMWRKMEDELLNTAGSESARKEKAQENKTIGGIMLFLVACWLAVTGIGEWLDVEWVIKAAYYGFAFTVVPLLVSLYK